MTQLTGERDTFRTKAPYKLTDAASEMVFNIKLKAEEMEALFDDMPISREKSCAMTKLEECVMWAVKGATASAKAN